MRILLVGDTHANQMAMSLALNHAVHIQADAIFQVGDFGYWPRIEHGRNFLESTSRAAVEADIPVYWIDGNHEDFQELHSNFGQYSNEPVKIRDHVYWLPRGCVVEWEGVRIMGFGGGASIDRATRTLGHSWFLEEMITDEDVERTQPVDIIISHDAPLFPLKRGVAMEDSEFCRQQMRRVVNKCQPELLVHGHYHVYHDTPAMREGGYTRVIGLGCDLDPDNMGILSLTAGVWEYIPTMDRVYHENY